MKTFMAFAFRDEDKPLVGCIERLLASQLIEIKTGEKLGGEQLTTTVQKRIEECAAIVALLTRREALQNGGWNTHQWVLDELGWARAKSKRAVALVEEGVAVNGLFQSHEKIPFSRGNMGDALVILSETVSQWKQEIGRTVKVQIAPESLVKKLGGGDDDMRCSHRLCLQGKFTPWQDVTPVPELGGVFVYLEGVQEEHLIQLQVKQGDKSWQSPATSQWMLVKLNASGGGK